MGFEFYVGRYEVWVSLASKRGSFNFLPKKTRDGISPSYNWGWVNFGIGRF